MDEYGKKSQIQLWTEEHFIVFDLHIRQMEDQVIWYRKEKLEKLAPSSFSYYLYERKIKEFRKKWDFLRDKAGVPEWDALEKLIKERMSELLKQDAISLEDYPENELILEIKELHERYCMEWLKCLYFNAEIPE